MSMNIFQLFFNYLEERPYNNIYQNVKQDADYMEATMQEKELNEQYKKLDLSNEQRKVIMQWIDAMQKDLLMRQLFSGWVRSAVFPC